MALRVMGGTKVVWGFALADLLDLVSFGMWMSNVGCFVDGILTYQFISMSSAVSLSRARVSKKKEVGTN